MWRNSDASGCQLIIVEKKEETKEGVWAPRLSGPLKKVMASASGQIKEAQTHTFLSSSFRLFCSFVAGFFSGPKAAFLGAAIDAPRKNIDVFVDEAGRLCCSATLTVPEKAHGMGARD